MVRPGRLTDVEDQVEQKLRMMLKLLVVGAVFIEIGRNVKNKTKQKNRFGFYSFLRGNKVKLSFRHNGV